MAPDDGWYTELALLCLVYRATFVHQVVNWVRMSVILLASIFVAIFDNKINIACWKKRYILPLNKCSQEYVVATFYFLKILYNFRQVLANVHEMLKPGGQFMFNAFEEVFTDEAFEKLDQGKWCKYNKSKAISPFYKYDNVLKEYEKVINNVGFIICHLYTEKFDHRLPLESFTSKIIYKFKMN